MVDAQLIHIAIAVAAAAAASLALRTADARWMVLLVGLCLIVVPLAATPPTAPVLAFWLIAVLLSTYLLWIAVRDTTRLVASLPLGGTAEALFAGLGFVLGWLAAPVAAPLRGTDAAVGAAFALAISALAMAAFGRDSLRGGIGGLLAMGAAIFLWIGFTGRPQELLLLALALALVAGAAATLVFTQAAYRLRGELELAPRSHDLRDRP